MIDRRGMNRKCEDCTKDCRNDVCNKCKTLRKTASGICKRCEDKVDGTRSLVLCTLHLEESTESGRRTYSPAKKRQYYLDNKDKILTTHKTYEQGLRDSGDLKYRLRRNCLSRLRDFILSTKAGKKLGSLSKSLGCTYEELSLHLEGQFYNCPETGEEMTWDNYGVHGWHLDHVVPLSKFNLSDPFHFRLANNYQNIQPMWAKSNIVKGNKVTNHVIWLDEEPYLIEGKDDE